MKYAVLLACALMMGEIQSTSRIPIVYLLPGGKSGFSSCDPWRDCPLSMNSTRPYDNSTTAQNPAGDSNAGHRAPIVLGAVALAVLTIYAANRSYGGDSSRMVRP